MAKTKKVFIAALSTLLLVVCFSVHMLTVRGSEVYVESAQDSRFSYCENADGTIKVRVTSGTSFAGELVIPSELDSKKVTAVAERGFIGQKLITSLVIPETVTAIGESAFANCTTLVNVSVLGKITDIGLYPFFATPFESKLKTDGDFVIFNEDILYDYTGTSEKIVIPDGIRVISGNLFTYFETQRDFEIKYVTFPKSVEYICSKAFYDCNNIVNISLETNIKSIGMNAFTAADMAVIGYYETYAESYAKDHGFTFEPLIAYGEMSENCYVRYSDNFRQHYFSDEAEFSREGVYVYRINYNGKEVEVTDWVYSLTPSELYGK